MAEVELNRVSKLFGAVPAVDDVSLRVADGEFLVLVGPSGCGKSTILRIIAGLEDETSGTVSIGGAVVTGMPPKLRDIAMVFQNYALYPHMSVADNLAFALRLRKVPREERERLVLETSRMLELDEYLDRKPKALSGGQRQRVAMGRAIVRNPRVFLMDEPLSNLDAKLRVSMRAELRRLHDQHASTTIYVTHDQIEAMTLGDRIAVIDHGRLQQVGTPHELYDRPANLFVAGFIGSPSMNFTPARLLPGTPPVLAAGLLRWPVGDDLAARLPDLAGIAAAGGTVILGLRPDAFVWPAPAGLPAIEVTAVGVEALGHESHVLFAPPEDMQTADPVTPHTAEAAPLWSAKIRGRCDLRVGDTVVLGVDLAGAHCFDPATGAALRPEARRPAPAMAA